MSEPADQAMNEENAEKENKEKSVSEPVELEERSVSELSEQVTMKSVAEPAEQATNDENSCERK